jgi:site-specific DNA recombinase
VVKDGFVLLESECPKKEKAMRAAIYCRVSTSGQAENGTSLESQRDACLKLAAERGYEVPTECVFVEDLSGADLDRPLLERVRELVRVYEVDAWSATPWTA